MNIMTESKPTPASLAALAKRKKSRAALEAFKQKEAERSAPVVTRTRVAYTNKTGR